jgi:ABC-type branched-subunit amino acid transport system substrate-binding protein
MKRRTFLVASTAIVGTALLPRVAGAADPISWLDHSLTGGYATIEDPALKGAQLAIKQVNAAGGVKDSKSS